MDFYIQIVPGHKPRIKVAKDTFDFKNPRKSVAIFISDNPAVMAGEENIGSGSKKVIDHETKDIVFDWVRLNKEILLKYWNKEENDTKVVLNQLQKLGG